MITLHTNFGDIKLELNEEKAPKTVANFIKYFCFIYNFLIPALIIQTERHAAGNQQEQHNHL